MRQNFNNKETRICSDCKKELPNTEQYFYVKNRKTMLLYSYCKTCYNEIQKQRHNETKQRLLDYKGKECIICGYKKCNSSLTFHHLDSEDKELAIAQSSRTLELLKKEVDKCIVVCRNCHGEIHVGLHPQYIK